MLKGSTRVRVAALALAGTAALAAAANASAATVSGRPAVRPLVRAGQLGRGTVTSTNWSGYAATNSTFSDVAGTWQEPAVTCPRGGNQYSSFWVGLDGYTSDTVEQIGTDSDCSRGRPSYYAWYEMYPSNSYEIPLTIHAGDTLSASVVFSGTSTYTLTIIDSTTGKSYSTPQTLTGASRSSAEWIAESPEICSIFTCSLASLADFGTVGFTGATAGTSPSTSEPIDDFSNSEIVMETSNGTVRAQPSSLGPSGSSFTDTWKHS